MERLQGHINNSYFMDQKVDVGRSLEVQRFEEASRFVFEEEESIKEPSFLMLLSLKEPWQQQLESYISQEDRKPEFHSPVQSNTMEGGNNQALSHQEPNLILPSSSSSKRKRKISHQETTTRGEKRKRKRNKPAKNIEELENQRINHIAVERNRRRQMSEHINSLRSLLPPSYLHRGDQASIVGGAIDYVKVLEQIIQSLESQKKTQQNNQEASTNNPLSSISSNNLWATQEDDQSFNPKIEVNVIQDHVNLKVQCLKKQGQLLKGIISFEKLKFTVLHLNIASSSHSSVSYCFNLKMEDDCDLESAEEITAAAHRIFDIPAI